MTLSVVFLLAARLDSLMARLSGIRQIPEGSTMGVKRSSKVPDSRSMNLKISRGLALPTHPLSPTRDPCLSPRCALTVRKTGFFAEGGPSGRYYWKSFEMIRHIPYSPF